MQRVYRLLAIMVTMVVGLALSTWPGGIIRAQSELNHGSIFLFTLPLA